MEVTKGSFWALLPPQKKVETLFTANFLYGICTLASLKIPQKTKLFLAGLSLEILKMRYYFVCNCNYVTDYISFDKAQNLKISMCPTISYRKIFAETIWFLCEIWFSFYWSRQKFEVTYIFIRQTSYFWAMRQIWSSMSRTDFQFVCKKAYERVS